MKDLMKIKLMIYYTIIFKSKPTTYVCTGVKEPFEIYDTESECTEYPEKRNEKKPITKFITVSDKLWDKMKDADRVVFEKASDKVLGLVYYAEKRN